MISNIEKVQNLFKDGKLKHATNKEIYSIAGITNYNQVYQITKKLVARGILKEKMNRNVWEFSLHKQEDQEIGDCSPQNNSIAQEAIYTQAREIPSVIKKIGFENIGIWHLIDGEIDYSLSKYENARQIMYAFKVNEEVLYLGKTSRSLKQRLNGYRKPGPTQSTNIKNNQRIKSLLEENKQVEIWVFKPKDEWKFNGVPINLAAGLEDNLISIIKPLWNSTGK